MSHQLVLLWQRLYKKEFDFFLLLKQKVDLPTRLCVGKCKKQNSMINHENFI